MVKTKGAAPTDHEKLIHARFIQTTTCAKICNIILLGIARLHEEKTSLGTSELGWRNLECHMENEKVLFEVTAIVFGLERRFGN